MYIESSKIVSNYFDYLTKHCVWSLDFFFSNHPTKKIQYLLARGMLSHITIDLIYHRTPYGSTAHLCFIHHI